MHPMLNIAVRAARKAGNLIAKNYETPDTVETSQKGSNDFVTNVDKAAEAVIIDTIRKSYPQHTIITEESGEHEGADRMYNGLSIHWMAPPTSSNVCRTSRYLSPFVLKAALKSRWFTIRCVTNCSPPLAVRAHSSMVTVCAAALPAIWMAPSGDRFPVQSQTARHYLYEYRWQTVHRMRRFPPHRFRCAGSGLRCRRSR